jgi:hypothetical protein
MPRREAEPHMHEYNDKWQCKCGYRLVTEIDSKSGWIRVKGYVTRDGEIKQLEHGSSESTEEPQKSKRGVGHRHSDGSD